MRVYWKIRLLNPEKLPRRGPCFFYGNHSNMLDAFILNCFTPWSDPTGGVLTQEFYRRKFIRWSLLNFDVHPTKKRLAEPKLIRAIKGMIDRDRKIVIYPEGGSRWDGTPMPWIETTAKIFLRSDIPVYPVVMHGSYATWPRWADYPRRGLIEVEVLDPIQLPRDTPLDLALQKYQQPIAFDESIVPDRFKPWKAKRPASGIHRLLYRDPDTGEQDGIFTPDGHVVQNQSGSIRYRMCADSSLVDEVSGKLFTTSELYDRISKLPPQSDSNGVFLANVVDYSTEDEFPNLVQHGQSRATLFDDHIEVRGSASKRSIDFEDVIGFDVERNSKLQVFTANEMHQFYFTENGSALGWRDAIHRLMN